MRSARVVYISLIADVLIAASKFIAAAFTGSVSMLSEGIHSVIDVISQILLIWGIKISQKPADGDRPFGYGKELYFWSFVVSLIIFSLGGCISVIEGILRFKHATLDGNAQWNYAVLSLAILFTSISFSAALKNFNRERGKKKFWKAVMESKDPATFIVLLGDIADMAGLVIAFLGVLLGRTLHNPTYDGVASILIGVILAVISGLLVRESKSLLMGEVTGRRTSQKIVQLAEADNAVLRVKKHFSTYMAPDDVLLQLTVVFKDALETRQITDAIERISKQIQEEFPRIKQIFIEPVAK